MRTRQRLRLRQMRPLFIGNDNPDDIDLLDDIPELQFEDLETAPEVHHKYNYFSWEF